MFHSIYGLSEVKSKLGYVISSDNCPPNLAFIGGKGFGKYSTALEFAKALNCQFKNACGKCEACLVADINPDFYLAGVTIDDIRKTIDYISVKPQITKYKIVYINDSNNLNNEAANAILKNLEEPPANVIFILAMTSEQAVPNTIISRLTKIYFPPPTNDVVIRVLKEKFNWSDAEINLYANHFVAGLNPDIINNWQVFNSNRLKLIYLLFLKSSSRFDLIAATDQLAKDLTHDMLLKIILAIIKDYIFMLSSVPGMVINNEIKLNFHRQKSLNLEEHFLLYNLALEAEIALSSQTNFNLIINNLLISLKKLIQNDVING